MKSLLSYFIKFLDNRSMLSKIYLKDYVVGSLNWRLIIMIMYDKNIFFVNNNWQKV